MLSKEAMLSTKITISEINCQIRASRSILGLVKVTVTSPVGLMKCFLNVEPCVIGLFIRCSIQCVNFDVLFDVFQADVVDGLFEYASGFELLHLNDTEIGLFTAVVLATIGKIISHKLP